MNNSDFGIIFKKIKQIKFNERQIKNIFVLYSLNKGLLLKEKLNNLENKIHKTNIFNEILNSLQTDKDIEFFILALRLVSIQPLLKEQQKLKNIISDSKAKKRISTLEEIILSTKNYKKMTLISNDTVEYLQYLSSELSKFQFKEVRCY